MIIGTLKFALLFFVVLVVGACSHLNDTLPENHVKPKPVDKLPTSWNTRGRIAILHPSENWHASFVWLKTPDSYSLRFTGPLGQTQLMVEHMAESEGREEKNMLLMDNEKYQDNASMEALLAQYSPIYIPLSSLQYWLFGQANPKVSASNKKDNGGHLTKLQQQGWTISFKNYQVIAGQYYPTKITAQKGEHKIKVFIKSREIE